MTRRGLAIGTLCCWLGATSGLMLALHLAYEHDGHDQGSCTVCQALQGNKASAPQNEAGVAFHAPLRQNEPRPVTERFAAPDPARPIASRAPPAR
ncbi:MAG TPA: hypothetical protein PKY77_04755 [Phycisphaerae bacterium]|nr:hypothetical protein [Phycisphaerae bacterium]HRY67170.1 hypothetical protein [Phycisphaerae bacterium]HSA26461.1 hypothetical protein [Phycisphaerae bacterium]